MQTNEKSNSVITTEYDEESGVMQFTVLGVGKLEMNLNRVHERNKAYAAVHGFGQRIPDAAAIPRADRDGALIPEDDRRQMKFDKMRKVIEHYESGTDAWAMVGSGGGGGKSLTIEAMAQVKGVEYEAAKLIAQEKADEHFKGDMRKALAVFATGEKIAAAMRSIKASRMPASGIDPDEMLEQA